MSLRVRVWFCQVLLLVGNMAGIKDDEDKRHSYFYGVEVTGKEEEFGLWHNVLSLLSCTALCVKYNDPSTTHCVGAQFEEHTLTCRLLSSYVNWTPSTSLLGDNALYRKDRRCLEPEGFQVIKVSGIEFCLGLFIQYLNYTEAWSKCLDKGANLLSLDSEAKHQAAVMVLDDVTFPRAWVGITDRHQEGLWVNELTGRPLTSEIEGHWFSGEPNNGGVPDGHALEEDCGHLVDDGPPRPWPINDAPCSYPRASYICEIL